VVDDNLVISWVDLSYVVATPTDPASNQLNSMWRWVDQLRLGGNTDENLAAAEHYLYARWLVSAYGPPMQALLLAMGTVYDLLKCVKQNYPSLPSPMDWMQESSAPPSVSSPEQWTWTSKGLTDGETDFEQGGTIVTLPSAPEPEDFDESAEGS
jgi:hypothetical protein